MSLIHFYSTQHGVPTRVQVRRRRGELTPLMPLSRGAVATEKIVAGCRRALSLAFPPSLQTPVRSVGRNDARLKPVVSLLNKEQALLRSVSERGAELTLILKGEGDGPTEDLVTL